MKKQVSAILTAGMAASLLVGCGGGSTSTAPAESTSTAASTEAAAPAESTEAGQAADITLWTYPIGKWGDSESVDALLADFNAQYPDIHVTVEYLDYTNGDDQVNTAIEGGSAPDLVMEGPERLVANWGAKGLMVDLSDLWTDDQKADISASVESACKDSSGAYYEFPLCMTAHCMAINKTVFEAADAMQYVDAENHTWTTDNFLKAVQAVYDSGKTDV
ncbi:extracellular solute-binding protein, partial [Gemmiger sp.]